MRCRKCGKEILDNEVFCEECKNELKRASSRSEVRELEDLIENQMDEFEVTKELVELDNLNEELGENKDLKDKTEVIDESEKEAVENNDSNRIDNPKNSNKRIIIILVCIISSLMIIIIAILLVIKFNKNDDKKLSANVDIDYEEVLNDYGKEVEKIAKDYVGENKESLTWQQLNLLITYDKYDIVCDIHNIYSDGSIYLNECKIDNKKIKYSYGTLKEEKKEGLKINIYKLSTDSGYRYTIDNNNSTLVGTVTCITDDCKYINAYDKYALIKEDKYYLYNYESDELEFGPFDIENDNYQLNMISYSNKLYGILYKDTEYNLYSVDAGKTFKNIKGDIVVSDMSFDPTIMYKYNYLMLKNNNKYDFINLKTGKVGFTVKENISSLVEDSKNNLVYIIAYKNNINNFIVYNSNGKLLFDGEEFNKISFLDDELIVSNKTSFSVYDSKLKLKLSSKKYDSILALYKDYIVVIDDKKLELLNSDEKILATFIDDFEIERYEFDTKLSGIQTINNKNGICLYIIDNDILDETKNEIKYYYIFETKEIGKIDPNNLEN